MNTNLMHASCHDMDTTSTAEPVDIANVRAKMQRILERYPTTSEKFQPGRTLLIECLDRFGARSLPTVPPARLPELYEVLSTVYDTGKLPPEYVPLSKSKNAGGYVKSRLDLAGEQLAIAIDPRAEKRLNRVASAANLAAARANGAKLFVRVPPCPTCGNNIYYVSAPHTCKHCLSVRGAKRTTSYHALTASTAEPETQSAPAPVPAPRSQSRQVPAERAVWMALAAIQKDHRLLMRDYKRLATQHHSLSLWAMRRGYKYAKRRKAFLAGDTE